MNAHEQTNALTDEDRRLVDLVSAALVDPNLHTDTRLRLAREITEQLQTAREAQGHAPHNQPPVVADHELPTLLAAALVDPNLHTDLRMRLHREIPLLLEAAHQRSVRRLGPAVRK
jgi:hypothetical protein